MRNLTQFEIASFESAKKRAEMFEAMIKKTAETHVKHGNWDKFVESIGDRLVSNGDDTIWMTAIIVAIANNAKSIIESQNTAKEAAMLFGMYSAFEKKGGDPVQAHIMAHQWNILPNMAAQMMEMVRGAIADMENVPDGTR